MSEQGGTSGAFEAKRRRWYAGGALAGAVVVVGGVVAAAMLDPEPALPTMHVSRTAPRIAAMLAAQADGGTPMAAQGADPPAKEPVFPPIVDEPLAIEHADDGEVDHLGRADDAQKAGDGDLAVEEVRAQLAHAPDDAMVLWRLVRTASGALSDRALEQLVAVAKTDAEAPRELARRHLDQDDAEGALPFAVEACLREPSSWESWHLKGRALMAQHKLGPAVTAYRRATEQGGAPSFPFNNLGYALLHAGRPSQALVALDTAVERGPVTAYMMNNLGLAYERLGRLDEAEVAFLGALELRGDYVKAQVNLARVGDTKELIARQDEEQKAAEAKGAETQAATGEAGTETAVPVNGAEHVEAGPLHGG